MEVESIVSEGTIVNVVGRLRGGGPGRRLVFNGHLDTFPAGDPETWSVDPFGGVRRDGRIYGRGVSDMKGGIACSMLAMELLSAHRDGWRGELVITLVGDEETMGQRGTAFLLDNVPFASGDAMISGDAGSPKVLRFGEKGMLWLELNAVGRPGHGAHVHLGDNAIDRLIAAIGRLNELRDVAIDAPRKVVRAIEKARGVSESVSGAGESRTLTSITVNCGIIGGGSTANLIPARAHAGVDIRLPVGVSAQEIENLIAERLASCPGVDYRVVRRYDPTWTDPGHEVIGLLVKSGREILGQDPAVNMRVGASDARLYRLRGLDAVVCGLTPHNMGGPDEYVTEADLKAVSHMHTLAAFDFLSAAHDPDPE
jgi:acetylornithine deacetylase/succinyl-diaminopimelate desuccinylase-like protein